MRSARHRSPFDGDPRAFEAFYRRHFDRITGFFARRVTDPHQVADLTAEVFLTAMDSGHTFDKGRGTEVGWLYGIARNVLHGEARRAGRFNRAMRRLGGHRLLDGDDVGELVDRIDSSEPARLALEAMASLPAGQREVLELVAIEQLDLSEAAQILGIEPGNARVRLHRARQTLAQIRGVTPPDTAVMAVEGQEGRS